MNEDRIPFSFYVDIVEERNTEWKGKNETLPSHADDDFHMLKWWNFFNSHNLHSCSVVEKLELHEGILRFLND